MDHLVTDDLRTRIAAILVGELKNQAWTYESRDGERLVIDGEVYPLTLADVLIAELGLRQEIIPRVTGRDEYRYCSDWNLTND